MSGGRSPATSPWKIVCNYFRDWRDDGTWDTLNEALRGQVRRRAGRDPTPSAGSIDSRTVKASEVGGPRGYGGGKRLKGRKRHIVVDTLGLLLAVTVTAATADDGAAAPRVLAKLSRESFPRPGKLWGDNKDHNHSLNEWVSEHGQYAIEVKARPSGGEGFKVIKWPWAEERTFAWMGRCRIHSRDYVRRADSSEAQLQVGMIRLMLSRLAGEKYRLPFRYPRPACKIAA